MSRWLAAVGVAVLAFFAGRLSMSGESTQPSSGEMLPTPREAPGAGPTSPAPSTRPSPAEVGRVREALAPVTAPVAPGVARTEQGSTVSVEAATCQTRLVELERKVKLDEEQRALEQGTAPSAPADDAPRFSGPSLKSTFEQAFAQSKVPGLVGGVDCSEYPCLLYGRIRGSEDFMERLEQTRALSAYENDILVALMWTATDEAERPRVRQGLAPEERLEQTLFVVTLYPRGLRASIGDQLDRRMRARTMALWSATSPFDETGR